MDRLIVKDRRILLFAGILTSAVFGIFICFSAAERIRNQERFLLVICMVIFGGGILAGLYLIFRYFRKRLIFAENKVTCVPVFGRRRWFSYSETAKLRITVFYGISVYEVLDGGDKRLAVFHKHMTGCDEAVHVLMRKGVRIDTLQKKGRFREEETGIDRKVTKGRRREADYIKRKWKITQIDRERNYVLLMSRGMIFLAVTAVLLPVKLRLSVYLVILWTIWAAYLILYPRMTVDPSAVKGISRYYITAPRAAYAASALALLFMTKTLNIPDNKEYFRFIFIYTAVLLVPYIAALYIKGMHERWSKALLVVFGAFVIAASTVNAVNYVATVEEGEHRWVAVTGKSREHIPGGATSYYVYVSVDGNERLLSVSAGLYQSAEKGDELRLCRNNSIFGYEYWVLHE